MPLGDVITVPTTASARQATLCASCRFGEALPQSDDLRCTWQPTEPLPVWLLQWCSIVAARTRPAVKWDCMPARPCGAWQERVRGGS